MQIRNQRPNQSPDLTGQRGVALIATLVFLFILTVIVVLFLNEVEDRIRYRAQTAGNEALRGIAYDYLEFSLGILKEYAQFDAPFLSAQQGWGAPLEYEPFPVEIEGLVANVRVEDAQAQIPLNRLDEDSFVVLLESLGIDAFTAAKYRDCYFDWIDSDDDTRLQGAEKREYELNRIFTPLTPANQSLKEISEFQFMMGFADWMNPQNSRAYNPELFHAFTRLITVDHDYPVNLNVAAPGVMAFFELLQRMNPEGIQRYLAGKDLMPGTVDDRMIDLSSADLPSQLRMAMGENISSELFTSETQLLRVVIDLRRHEAYTFHLEALVNINGGGSSTSVAQPKRSTTTEIENETEASTRDTDTSAVESRTVTNSGSSSFEVLVIKENM